MPAIQPNHNLIKIRKRQYRNPVRLAQQWQRAIQSGEYPSHTALAYHLGVSRARVTQILNLLKLSPEVVDMIHSLSDPISGPIVTERGLRPLLRLVAEQQKADVMVMLAKEQLFRKVNKYSWVQRLEGQDNILLIKPFSRSKIPILLQDYSNKEGKYVRKRRLSRYLGRSQ